jgi:predicted RNase H-like HicB family nuclease
VKYLVVFERTATGFSAYLPDLLGCAATGKTRAEVEANIKEAVALHIEGMKEDGETLPPAEAFAEYEEIRV